MFNNSTRIYNRPIEPDPEYVDIMTVDEWYTALSDGLFCTYDGSGYWVKDGLESRDEVFNSPPIDATHVAWYNK